MTIVTADHVRQLAKSTMEDAALVDAGGAVGVGPAGDVTEDRIVYTRQALVAEYGEEITDVEAEVLAAGLTAAASGSA